MTAEQREVTEVDVKSDTMALVKHILRSYAFPSVQWWEAEAAAMRLCAHYGQTIPPKRTGIQ